MKKVDMTIQSGVTRVLHTAGKYCDKDIIIKAEGGDYGKGYESGVADGKKAEYDAFWDMFQKNGTRTEYRYAFAYTDWTEEMFKPKYPFKLAGDNTYAFLGVQAVWEDKVFEVDTAEAVNLMWAFRLTKFKRIGKCDLSSATNIQGIFAFCSNLVSIAQIVAHESLVWHEAFFYSTNLEEVRFSGVIGKSIGFADCSKLSVDSVQSVIDHLKDLTGQTAQTLTFHATDKNNLTDAQKATISAKNWTLG